MYRTRIIRTNGALAPEIPDVVLETLGLEVGDEIGIDSTD
jgi:antitoxin component of MazEF toxin-antitoxin module